MYTIKGLNIASHKEEQKHTDFEKGIIPLVKLMTLKGLVNIEVTL